MPYGRVNRRYMWCIKYVYGPLVYCKNTLINVDKSRKSVDNLWVSGFKNVFVFYNTPNFYGCATMRLSISNNFKSGEQDMTISIDDFVKKYDGSSVDFDKQYGAQCVDLFNFYNSEVVGAPFIGTPITGGARDLYEHDSSARAENYKKLDANSPEQAGDVLVYGEPNGRYKVGNQTIFLGHVRIVVSPGVYIEQNARVAQKTIVDSDKVNGLLGILRPLKFIGGIVPQNEVSPPTNQNKHTIQKGDTFWGLEESNGWAHGTLQQLNPSLDAHALPIGGEMIIPAIKQEQPKSEERYYTVQPNDTYWGLEDAWQLPHGRLQQLNPQYPARQLPIGARIRIG